VATSLAILTFLSGVAKEDMDDEQPLVLDLDVPQQKRTVGAPEKTVIGEKRRHSNQNTSSSTLELPDYLTLSQPATNDKQDAPPKKKHRTSAPSSNLSSFLEELSPPATTKPPVIESKEPHPVHSFPRYHDYNIDEFPSKSSVDWVGFPCNQCTLIGSQRRRRRR